MNDKPVYCFLCERERIYSIDDFWLHCKYHHYDFFVQRADKIVSEAVNATYLPLFSEPDGQHPSILQLKPEYSRFKNYSPDRNNDDSPDGNSV